MYIKTSIFCYLFSSLDAKGAKILVYEYVPNGSLLDYIIGKFLDPKSPISVQYINIYKLSTCTRRINITFKCFRFMDKKNAGRKCRNMNWRQRVTVAIGAAKGKISC